MIKKIIAIFAALAVASGALADTKSDTLLGALQKKVDGLGAYRVAFRVTVDGQSMSGRYEVSGGSYHLWTEDTELFCDGAVKYEVNKPDSEVLIDKVDPADRTVMGNPTRMFDFLDGNYTHTWLGRSTLGGGEADRIELNGRDGMETDKITVYIGVKTGLPVRIAYFLENLNTDAIVDIDSITPHITIDRGTFDFDPVRYKGFETIDFR